MTPRACTRSSPTLRAHEQVRARLRQDPDQAAPHVIDAEVLGIIRRDHTLGRLDGTAAAQAVHDLRDWPGERLGHRLLLDRAWELRGRVRTWDALYVALAEVLRGAVDDPRLAAGEGRRPAGLRGRSAPRRPLADLASSAPTLATLVSRGVLDAELAALLWLLVEGGDVGFVVGGEDAALRTEVATALLHVNSIAPCRPARRRGPAAHARGAVWPPARWQRCRALGPWRGPGGD